MTLRKDLTIATPANMFNTAIDCKNKIKLKKAASNVNIKIQQLFSKQRILGFHVTILQ